MIREHYKGTRKDYDSLLDCPPWGQDTLKRKFYLVEGQVDTPTRVYREGDRKGGKPTWQAVAGDIADVQRLARNLRGEQSVAARTLADRMTKHIAVLEAREEKRKRREYRVNRKNHWARSDPGVSLYEGRTRGNRPRYTFDDDEIYGTDSSTRRSARQSGVSTPNTGPRFTASGRQVRSAFGASYGEPSRLREGASLSPDELSSGQRRDGRPTRSSRSTGQRGGSFDEGYESVDNADGDVDGVSSGEEWNGDDEEGDEARFDEEDNESDAVSDDSLDDDNEPRSLVVKLKCGKRLAELHTGRNKADKGDAMDVDDAPHADVKPNPYTTTLPLSPQKPQQPDLTEAEFRQAAIFSQYMYSQDAKATQNEHSGAKSASTMPAVPSDAVASMTGHAAASPSMADRNQTQDAPQRETPSYAFQQSQTASS